MDAELRNSGGKWFACSADRFPLQVDGVIKKHLAAFGEAPANLRTQEDSDIFPIVCFQ